MKLGTTEINKLFLGTTEIKRMFLGSTEVYDKVAAGGYTSVLVDTNGTANMTFSGTDIGADSSNCTIALHGNFQSDAGGAQFIFESASARFELRRILSTLIFQFDGAAGSALSTLEVSAAAGTPCTIVVTAQNHSTTPVFEVYRNGVALANTGNLATGYQFTVGPTAGLIDWTRTSESGYLGGNVDWRIGEFFIDTQQRINPALFHNGAALLDWSALGSPQIFLGHGMSAAQWNDPNPNNPGPTVLTITSATFTA